MNPGLASPDLRLWSWGIGSVFLKYQAISMVLLINLV